MALAAFTVMTAPADAVDGAGCTWTLTGAPAKYRIGLDKPTVQSSGSCTTGADNFRLTYDLHRADDTVLAGSSQTFQGCSSAWFDTTTQKCERLSNPGTTFEFPRISSLKLLVTTVGTFTAHLDPGSYAYDYGDTEGFSVSLSAFTFTAKIATTTGLAISRSGSKRTFTITPRHYSTSAGAFVASTNQSVDVQRYINGAWAHYRTVNSSSSRIVFSASFSRGYKWRAVTAATASRWGSRSAAVHR